MRLDEVEHRAPEYAIRVRERLLDLEVVVVPRGDELHRLACFLHRLREVARLALELGRLERADK